MISTHQMAKLLLEAVGVLGASFAHAASDHWPLFCIDIHSQLGNLACHSNNELLLHLCGNGGIYFLFRRGAVDNEIAPKIR